MRGDEVDPQQCDWCGRKGEPREYTICKGGGVYVSDPQLCDVCFLLLTAPGAVEDRWDDWPGAESAWQVFERALHARWLERKAQTG